MSLFKNSWRRGKFISEKELSKNDMIAHGQITENDTAWSLYKRTNTASVELFREMIPAIASGQIQSMRTPQSAFEGPRYYNLKSSLDSIKQISLADFTNENKALDVWDRIRALEFPPFEPAYIYIGDKKVYLNTNNYNMLTDI
jgi:methionyl-tRNA formyltransferase